MLTYTIAQFLGSEPETQHNTQSLWYNSCTIVIKGGLNLCKILTFQGKFQTKTNKIYAKNLQMIELLTEIVSI